MVFGLYLYQFYELYVIRLWQLIEDIAATTKPT